MQNLPLVSVICLCYNHEKYVIEALNSVIQQTYKNIELIILDDGSTDKSVSTIENWLQEKPNVYFIKNEINEGNTKAFNKASLFAKGEYLVDLAADDLLLSDCIALQVTQFQQTKYKNVGLVYGNLENIFENGSFISYFFEVDNNKNVVTKRSTGNIYKSVLEGGNSICSPSAMFKKKVYEEIGGYDETLLYEDLDFWIRLTRKYEVDFIDCILVQKRLLTNSLGEKFHHKKYSKIMSLSTVKILKKAFYLNKNRDENKALGKRINYEILLNTKYKNIKLLAELFYLKLKVKWNTNL